MSKANVWFRLQMLLFAALLLPCLGLAQVAGTNAAAPKYIFLFIGDGMGPSHRQAAELALGRKLTINHLPVSGTTTTHNVDGQTTDSAAAGTAIACGVKTKNGMLGVSPDGQPLESIAVKAKKAGMKVGMISSVPLNHATPAAFYAHAKARSKYDEIALQMADSDFDFFGGAKITESSQDKSEAWQRLKDHGYATIFNPAQLADKYEGKAYVYRYMPRVIDEKVKRGFTLPQITAAAIRSLDQDKGFFLMVEGGAIDWACHRNDGATAVREVEEFDQAVQEAIDFSAKKPGTCLVVVTADHETGGMTIVEPQKLPGLLKQTESEQEFALDVTTLAKKKADADAYLAEVKRFFQRDALTSEEEKELRQSWADFLAKGAKAEGLVPPSRDALRLFDQRCGLTWTTGGHTGTPVLTTAAGVCAEAFAGNFDNTDICRRLEKMLPGVSAVTGVKNRPE